MPSAKDLGVNYAALVKTNNAGLERFRARTVLCVAEDEQASLFYAYKLGQEANQMSTITRVCAFEPTEDLFSQVVTTLPARDTIALMKNLNAATDVAINYLSNRVSLAN